MLSDVAGFRSGCARSCARRIRLAPAAAEEVAHDARALRLQHPPPHLPSARGWSAGSRSMLCTSSV